MVLGSLFTAVGEFWPRSSLKPLSADVAGVMGVIIVVGGKTFGLGVMMVVDGRLVKGFMLVEFTLMLLELALTFAATTEPPALPAADVNTKLLFALEAALLSFCGVVC